MSKKTFFSCVHLYLLYLCAYFTFDSKKLPGCLIIAAIVFGIVLIGNKFKIRAGFLVGAVVLEFFILLLVRNKAELIMFSVFGIITMVAFTVKFSGEQEPFVLQNSPVWLIFVFLCYLPLYFTKYSGGNILCTLGCVYAIVYLLSMSVTNMEQFIKLHSSLEKLPVVQLGKTYVFSVLAVLLWVFFGMLIGRNEKLAGYLSEKIESFFSAVAFTPMKIVPDTSGLGGGNITAVDVKPIDTADMIMEQAYTGSPVFGYVLKILLYVLLFLLVLCVVYGIYCYLKKNKTDEGDLVEFIGEEEPEERIFLRRKRGIRKLRKTISANELIRKIYRKRIKAKMGKKIPLWASPKELETLAQWQETKENCQLHRLYEKARYSKEGCEKAEVDEYMKKR